MPILRISGRQRSTTATTRVTVTEYVPARVGTGMDREGEIVGEIVQLDDSPIRCYGCSFTWRRFTLRFLLPQPGLKRVHLNSYLGPVAPSYALHDADGGGKVRP